MRNIENFVDLLPVSAIKTSVIEYGENVKWVPIIQYKELGFCMGVLNDGQWVVEGKNGLSVLNESKTYIRAMVLLEKPIKIICEDGQSFFDSYNLDISINDLFPFYEIIKTGFEYGSEYWAELAFKWYDESSYKYKNILIDSLNEVFSSKWASQKLRQKARKEIKRISEHLKQY